MKSCTLLLVFATLAVLWITPDVAAEEGALQFGGDLRGRWEGFWFRTDETGSRKEGRRRLRYRLRLNGKAIINPHATVKFQVSTGGTDNRSGNQTLGTPVDFGANKFDIRRAYLTIMPYDNGVLPRDNGHWAFQFGRVPNPCVWKNGKDIMLWDSDINPGGASTTFDINVDDNTSFFVNGGVFVVAENSSAGDPYLTAIQGGVESQPSGNVNGGIRASWYYFGKLDSAFVQRGVDGAGGTTKSAGNIPDGLTGRVDGGTLSVVETQGFVTFGGGVLMTAFGGYSNNLSAQPSRLLPGVAKESVAYNLGMQVGDKKKTVLVGGGYWLIKANAFPSQFIDSDLLDGVTNRKGFLVYASRQILKSTRFNVQAFDSDVIETGPEFVGSAKAAERTRIQVDLVYKF